MHKNMFDMFKLKDKSKISIRITDHRKGYLGSGYPMVHAESFSIPNENMELVMRLVKLFSDDLFNLRNHEMREVVINQLIDEEKFRLEHPLFVATSKPLNKEDILREKHDLTKTKIFGSPGKDGVPGQDPAAGGTGGAGSYNDHGHPSENKIIYAPPSKPTTHKFSFTPENRD